MFGPLVTNTIKPHHVRAYLDKRGESAKARANREKAEHYVRRRIGKRAQPLR